MAFCPKIGWFAARFYAISAARRKKSGRIYRSKVDLCAGEKVDVYKCLNVAEAGLEKTARVKKRRKKPLAIRPWFPSLLIVVLPGFEPRQTEPKTVVLPLHHKTIVVPKRGAPRLKRCKVTHNSPFPQNFFRKILLKKFLLLPNKKISLTLRRPIAVRQP